jgi:hypothetical protein
MANIQSKIRFFIARVKHYYRIEIEAEHEWPDSKPFANVRDWFRSQIIDEHPENNETTSVGRGQ